LRDTRLKRNLCLWLLACCLICLPSFGQYYFTGKTVDANNSPLSFVKLRLHSSTTQYQSGSTGGFGLPSATKKDTITCILRGYDTLITIVSSGVENVLVLTPRKQMEQKPELANKLVSLTSNLNRELTYTKQLIGETYSEIVENGFVQTSQSPSTGFSPNSNNASYSNTRRFINNQSQVPPAAVRIEEMLNYFSLSVAKPPPPDEIFNIETQVTDCPWDSTHLLLFINAQAQTLNLENVPPANLVFLIDNSGSMDMPNRLPLLKSAFRMLVKNLRDVDRVAIVTYGGVASIALPPTSGQYKDKINKVIQEIMPGGATPGSNGIQMAYELATTNPIPNGNNRVILATDGDFNVGITAEKELEDLIERYRGTGVFLTCLGVGMGNYKDSKIEVLAKHGNGNFAYLDKEQEAEKVLVKELTQNLYAVASDVSFHIDLNPALIKEYRLIGYDNRLEAIADSSSKLLGGEIGSGYSMVSVFEIVPKDTTAAWRNRNLSANAGNIRVKYKPSVGRQEAMEKNVAIPFNYVTFYETDRRLRFATAICMFGSLLKQSPYAAHIKFEQIPPVAAASLQADDPLQIEFVELVEAARKIYFPEKKKKWSWRKDDE
jgi:Ca-activated chloride channel family protein